MVSRASLGIAVALLAACSSGAAPATQVPPTAAVVTTPPPPPASVTVTAPPTPPPTPAPTPAAFALRAQAGQPPGGFLVTVSGLDPNESFVLVTSVPGQRQFPRSWVADATGSFRLGFDQVGPGGSCLIAQRSNGQIARAEVGVAAGSSCTAEVAAPTPGPVGTPAPQSYYPPGAGPGVTPPAGPLGTAFIICFSGLPANAGPVVNSTYLRGRMLGSGSHPGATTSAIGSSCSSLQTGPQNGLPDIGTYTETVTVAGVTKSLDFEVR